MRRLTICAAAALATVAVAAPVSGAANPVAVTLAIAIKNQLQATMNKRAPGIKITTVTCTVAKSGTTARCKANFTARAAGKNGYYLLAVKSPPKGQITWTSTAVVCTDIKSGLKVHC